MLESTLSFTDTISALENTLNSIEPISIVAQVDHQANAVKAAKTLRPTHVTLFGNPRLGTPLMNVNQLAGLDLPQKMCVFEDELGKTQITYRSADYLRARYALNGVDEQLSTMSSALDSIASKASGTSVSNSSETLPDSEEGIVIINSRNDIESTHANLLQAIDTAEPLKMVAKLDHSDNARRVGLSLPPTRLVIFGNPVLGTTLMQSSQSTGIDLPQTMLVYQDDAGEVSVAYNDPVYIAQSHGITDQNDVVDKMSNALDGLARGAAGL